MWPEAELPEGVLPKKLLRAALLAAAVLGVASVGCDAALIGGSLVAVAGGTGILVAQCYDQVSVRVHDDEGRKTCDARVSIVSDGSERRLRPCYHASLTEGRYHVSVQRDGYVPADVQVDIPKHEGTCPHYTHTIEFTLRRTGAPPDPSAIHQLRPSETRARPPQRSALPAPIPGNPPAGPEPAAPAAPLPPSEPAAPAGPPSAAFPPAPTPVPPAPPAPEPPEPAPK